ncbi:sodium:calcium antiporter [Syntrophomonas curvata]
MKSIAILVASLGIILLAAELFVNGVEWLGKKLNLSEGAVGSVLAAVGTALPETIIPIIAILFGGQGSEGRDIGIGAILGAPLMLSTLAMFVTGLAVIIFRRRRMHGMKVVADYSTMSRDLLFFMIIFAVAILAGMIPPGLRTLQLAVAVIMVISYVVYVRTMFREERDIESDSEMPPCYFDRRQAALHRIAVQIIVALALIIFGANLFVESVKVVAVTYGVPAFVLALIVTPIATELPEKFNSVIWISREKDTLALGNITGAMVFQSSLIPALGIFLTDWQLTAGALFSAVLALLSALIMFTQLRIHKHISAPILMAGGLFYAVFLVAVFKGIVNC